MEFKIMGAIMISIGSVLIGSVSKSWLALVGILLLYFGTILFIG